MLPGKKYGVADVVDILRRRGWLLIVPPVVTLFGALIYSSTVPNRYRSDMLIAVVRQRVPDEFVRSTVTLRTEERLDAISVDVRSRAKLEQLITEFELYPKERAKFPMEDVVRMMDESIEVELERPRPSARNEETPPAFHVRFTYTDPTIAARITQKLGSAFVDQNSRDRGALAGATSQFLEAQLEQARQQLEATEARLKVFREKNGQALPTQMQTNMQGIQSTQLQIQALVESMARDRDRKLVLESLYRQAVSDPALVPQAVLAPQTPGTLPANATAQQQLVAARNQLAALELRYKPDYPEVIRLKKVIAELEPKAAEEARQAADQAATGSTTPALPATSEEVNRRERLRTQAAEIESLDRQIEFKEDAERRLRAVAAEYQRRIESTPGIESEWVALSRDYDTQMAAYKDLLGKSDNSKLAVELERRQISEQFRILDAARVPVNPIGPMRLQITGLGFAAGLFLGIAIAGLLEFRDSSFRSETDVFDVLALPVIAVVPYVETASEKIRRSKQKMLLTATAVVFAVGAGVVFWALRLWTVVV